MPRFVVDVRVMPRASLLDPQGQAVEHALNALGFEGMSEVRVGRALSFGLQSANRSAAERDATRMCERLLANPITEDFTITLREVS